jgi:hypothetical protein
MARKIRPNAILRTEIVPTTFAFNLLSWSDPEGNEPVTVGGPAPKLWPQPQSPWEQTTVREPKMKPG